jgi:hypothetical protein
MKLLSIAWNIINPFVKKEYSVKTMGKVLAKQKEAKV